MMDKAKNIKLTTQLHKKLPLAILIIPTTIVMNNAGIVGSYVSFYSVLIAFGSDPSKVF